MQNDPARYDAVIIGGGAAGLMCAITAGQRGRRVALVEHNEQVGKKITISGGGRCNFTNIHATAANYISASPDFCKSALARYTPQDFITLVEKHRIPYHEKKLGQQFCDGSSREIIAMLLDECAAAGVEILCNRSVKEVRKPELFTLETNRGTLECDSLAVATGGLSFAKLGATGFGHRIARQYGLHLTEMRPGLVPLTFDSADAALRELSGVSLPVVTCHAGVKFEEAMLFTHRGVSGPAILQISSYWRENETLRIDLLPAFPGNDWLFAQRQSQTTLKDLLGSRLPRRFAEAWCARHAPEKPLRHCKTTDLESAARLLHEWPLNFSGTEGYPKAEVTLGGVDTRELSSKTMEAKKVPGLYFIGEVVDVTGWLGGYNFQWAWASGHAAGEFV